jgi:hypothetical protein
MTEMKAPAIGRPRESTAVPLILAVRVGTSENTSPDTSSPTPTVTLSAC